MKIIYLFFICGFFLVQSVGATLIPSFEQKTIVVDHLDNKGRLIALDGTVFELISPEVKKQARMYKKQSVHVLYMNMGGKYVVSEMKSAIDPLFVIPARVPKKKTTPK